jgi:hypothetical protein
MRRLNVARYVVLLAMSFVIVIVFAASGGAQVEQNMLTIKKVVDGPAPTGTTFTVSVACAENNGSGPTTTTTMHFDASGTPTDSNVVGAPDFTVCTATETVNGGASSVSYSCALTFGSTDPSHLSQCSTDGKTATFADEVLNDTATITVTNTFTPPAPPPPPTAAPAVVSAPTFTG